MAKTTYFANKTLGHMSGAATYTPPNPLFAALFTVAPTIAGGGTEVSGGSYARQPITWGAAGSGKMANSARINFPTATADQGTAICVAICEAVSGGNILQFDALPRALAIFTNDQPFFDVGELEWDET